MTDTDIDSDLMQPLLVESAEGRDTLPLLQHTLTLLREMREESASGAWRITAAHYRALGGMAKALNDHADDVLAKLSLERQALAEKLFKELNEVGEGRDQRRPQRLNHLATRTSTALPEITAVAEHFLVASFLTSPDRGRVGAEDWEVDVSHESLIRQWRTLNAWTLQEAEDREDYLYLVERVKRGGELLTGADLLLGLKLRDRKHRPEWAKRYGGDFASIVDLIEHSWSIQEQQRKAEASRRRLRKIVKAGLLALAMLGLGTGILRKYRDYQVQKAQLEVENVRQQGVSAARAVTQALEDARTGELGPALRQLAIAGNTDPTLPMDVLDNAIADAARRNDGALNNLKTAREYYVASRNLVAVARNAVVLRTENGGSNW